MFNVYDTLLERGFIEQSTNDDKVRSLLNNEKITFYIGFDPTADSLTAGHFLTIMATSYLQKAGHRPVILVGGGTGMVGDPSHRTDMRQMMTEDTIQHNVNRFKEQLSRFIDFSDDKAIIVNNASWLKDLNYIDFIRKVGVHFSVNRMLTAECFKSRFERGLSFFEFNYMIMQSYDFLQLNKTYDCKLQLGGSDQWSNIIGGIELIRRMEQKDAYGLTLKLLTTSDGVKMGKTQKGAIWLAKDKTSPYDFYQYFRNVADTDVKKFLLLLTFLPTDKINSLCALEGQALNKAKEVLAFEITKLVHGEDEATKALNAAKALFEGGAKSLDTPSTTLDKDIFKDGINILDLLFNIKLTPSKAEARRLVQQGGIKVNNQKIDDITFNITLNDFENGEILIQKGKKTFHYVKIK